MTNNLEKVIFIFQTQLKLGWIHILYTVLIFTVKRLLTRFLTQKG